MAIIGNIFLSIATLVFFLMVSATFGKEPPRSGDAAMGYPLGVIFFHLILLACLIVAAITIAWKGGFDWISPNKSTRNMLVASGLVLAVVTSALSALFKYEPGSPALLRLFSGFAPALIPFVLIASGFILLNTGLRDALPIALYKWPLTGVFALGILGVGAGIFGWIASESQNAARRAETAISDQGRNHQSHLDEIANCDVTKNMVFILVFTDANHDEDVRNAAVAKIKTNPKWQEELIRLMGNRYATEVFNFLASNDVDDKSLFAEPINTGILSIAEWVRQQTRNSTSFYSDMFSWEVDRVLRTVAKFEGMGKDYRPAVAALRAALDEPAKVEKVKLDCTAVLDQWIKKHR